MSEPLDVAIDWEKCMGSGNCVFWAPGTFDLGEDGQGIVHVTGPEQGIVLPGLTVICGDSHTCTNGALGAIAFGVGNSQSTQALGRGAIGHHVAKDKAKKAAQDSATAQVH